MMAILFQTQGSLLLMLLPWQLIFRLSIIVDTYSQNVSTPPLAWCRMDPAQTTSWSGHSFRFVLLLMLYNLFECWGMKRIKWSKSSLDYYAVWVSRHCLPNRTPRDKCYLWPNKDLETICFLLCHAVKNPKSFRINMVQVSIKGRVWISLL